MEDTDVKDLKEKYKRFRETKELKKDGRNYTPKYRDFDEENYNIETLETIMDKIGKDTFEDKLKSIRQMALTCLNCGYRSLFFDFVHGRGRTNSHGHVYSNGDSYDKEFSCPRCQSTYVGYRDKDINEVVVDLL